MTKSIKKLLVHYPANCMLTNRRDSLRYHHLIKEQYTGQNTVENGALLNQDIHFWLHQYMEIYEPKLYDQIGDCIQGYKEALKLHKEELIEQYRTEVMPAIKKMYKKTRKKLH